MIDLAQERVFLFDFTLSTIINARESGTVAELFCMLEGTKSAVSAAVGLRDGLKWRWV